VVSSFNGSGGDIELFHSVYPVLAAEEKSMMAGCFCESNHL
jgi:hypothetical protein